MEILIRPWKLYADMGGRSRRLEFWSFFILRYGVFALLFVLGGGLGPRESYNALAFLGLVWLLASFLPSCALLVRRCHDFDASGKWALTTFIPYIGFIAAAVIGLMTGTRGENERGFDPRDPDPYSIAEVFE